MQFFQMAPAPGFQMVAKNREFRMDVLRHFSVAHRNHRVANAHELIWMGPFKRLIKLRHEEQCAG